MCSRQCHCYNSKETCHLLNINPVGQWVQDPYLCWFPDQQDSRCSCSASGSLQFFRTQTFSDGAPAQGAALLKSPFDWSQSRTQQNKHRGEIKSEDTQRTRQFMGMYSDQQGKKENVPQKVLFVGVHQTFNRSDTQERTRQKNSFICYKYANHTAVEQMFLTPAWPSGLSTWEFMCSQAQRDK